MRVSQYYKLKQTQGSLDFVDVDISADIKLFVDPRALHNFSSDWGLDCVELVQDYFQGILDAIKNGKRNEKWRLSAALVEPNDAHLGLSRGSRSRGRRGGINVAEKAWTALSNSQAIKSGAIKDLEDTILLVEGIGPDIISDMMINLLRGKLIEYTKEMCNLYGIPLQANVDSGPVWDEVAQGWNSNYEIRPVTSSGSLLLIPKAIVRARLDYSLDEYYRNHIIRHWRNQELSANTELVRMLVNGGRRVWAKDLRKKYGSGKRVIIEETLKSPKLLDEYRKAKDQKISSPLDNYQLSDAIKGPIPDWDGWKKRLRALNPGKRDAYKYEELIEIILSGTLYPDLCHPKIQKPVHEGRKRIDITYTNLGGEGFFLWLQNNYVAPHVFVECKNYGKEIGNPELDQLAGRFSDKRGVFGLLVCRSFDDKSLFWKRCKDTALDNRGFIIPIDDSDLIDLMELRKNSDHKGLFSFFKDRFDRLIM